MSAQELFEVPAGTAAVLEEVILSSNEEDAYRAMEPFIEAFHLHPLTVDDCVRRNQRSKIEAFQGYLFLVWHFFTPRAAEPFEVHLCISRDSMLIVATEPPPTGTTWTQMFFPDGWRRLTLKQLVTQVLATGVTAAEEYLEVLAEEATALEEDMLDHVIDPADVLRLKRHTREFDRVMLSANPLFQQLLEFTKLTPEERFHFRNVTDHFARLTETTRMLHTQLATLLDVHWGAMGLRTNAQMQRLTVIATLVMPISFWSGLFGMNFETMPFKSDGFFYGGVAVMVLTWVGVVAYMFTRGVLIKPKAGRRPELFPREPVSPVQLPRAPVMRDPTPSAKEGII